MGYVRFKDVFCKLVGTHLLIARQSIRDQVVNVYIWTSITLVIMGYIMQKFGLASDYGAFQFASILAVIGFFEVYSMATTIIMDIDGDRHISYNLTLPARPSVVLLSMACSYALVSIFLTIVLLPFGSFILHNSFSFAAVSWVKFAIILVLANIFFALFMLAMAAHVGTISKLRNIWMRFMWPLWFLGCYQFSWKALYTLSVPFAYFVLCNPITFITEGVRASILGQHDFLPWEVCCSALCFFIIVCWYYAYYKMKRLLDFV